MGIYGYKSPPPAMSQHRQRRIQPEQVEDAHSKVLIEPRVGTLAKLEGAVSMLQVAKVSLKRMKGYLEEMKDFLETEAEGSGESALAPSVINNYLIDRIKLIERHAQAASFQGRALLNGRSGASGQAKGESLQFVKGSARVKSTLTGGYPVAIEQEATSASLVGVEKVSDGLLAGESMIAINDGAQEVKYSIKRDETPETLVTNLQRSLWKGGLDISVYLSRDQRLVLIYNQQGSKHGFAGKSMNSRLISTFPGEYHKSEAGLDVQGKIGGEPAIGDGTILTGKTGNPRTDGLSIFYDGRMQYQGEIVGYVEVEQRGLIVPLDLAGRRQEILSLPSLLPESQAIGRGNPSGFTSLGEIQGGSSRERADSLKLIRWSLGELEHLSKDLNWKEEDYVSKAIDLLKNGGIGTMAEPPPPLSSSKAGQTADQMAAHMHAQFAS